MRTLPLVLAWMLLGCAAASAQDDAALRTQLRRALHDGYADAGPGLPNLPDLLTARFPGDMDAFIDKAAEAVKAHRLGDIKSSIAATLVAIQARDGDQIRAAPKDDLVAVVRAQQDIVLAITPDNPALCKVLAGGGPAQAAPSKAVGDIFARRLYLLLAAIADGRDRPVGNRALQADDYRQFALEARDRGVDIKAWEVLAPDRIAAAAPDQICTALASSYDAVLTADDPVGERVLADMTASLLVKDAGVYQPALGR
ncbi:hypothetical protein [Labrys wisconsinensis]|uniref:Uncharacterized protein n=1 Tax=Labrys wisconsinensis TaxID=425677 RepID=A0ABU0JGU9_9HYPH|nr:hypothetical protein [Labrys wisconsinensis]MDQ0473517.1 hypothetical protein [Labrys wisconsinensis]